MIHAHPIHTDKNGYRVRIGVIVWTVDPEGVKRYFIRHNKPFDGHYDEWNMIFGSVEPEEDLSSAAIREVHEESGIIIEQTALTDLHYSLSYIATAGPTIIHFFSAKVRSIDAPVSLNEESIGYDWATIDDVSQRVPYTEQVEAFTLIV
jgi:8-oxo-dGTP pyrophosphatase MutT (NUDIX family)